MSTFISALFGATGASRSRASLINRLHLAAALHRSRARLASLDAHMLDDIGVSKRDAKAEAERSVWDAPHGWTR